MADLPASGQKLNARQRAFVTEYLKDRNAQNAAIRAGYSSNGARQIGSRLLSYVDIRAAIDAADSEILEHVKHETGITLERTIREIARVAFSADPRKFFHDDGTPKAIHELDDDTAATLTGLDVSEVKLGSDAADGKAVVRKYKIADRRGYLDMLMKHFGGYKADNDATVTVKEESMGENELARRIAFALHQGLKAKETP